MKRMLINATQPEELRVAIVDGQKLYDLDIETPSREQKKSNIYKGRITRVEPSLEAAFVDYGAERHGFLPLKEIAREYFIEGSYSGSGRPNIRDVIKQGQEVVVQVDKEERGNKGAALTTFISLAGRYLVLMPNNPRAGGVSRRIEGEDRREIKRILGELDIPSEMGLIVRTAGLGKELEELQWDLDYLKQLWSAIAKAAQSRQAPFLIYQESNLIIRALRDYLRNDIGEIIIDSEDVHKQAVEFMEHVMPHNLRKLKLYRDSTPLFSRYQIESQIESAFAREVRLPSGGSIVMDHTEALISIDINSARATKGADIEETALQTNLEAADEIARQLRIRDLGGLVVIDFIDMYDHKNQRAVEERLKEALKMDRARIQTSRISRFGLLEMSRQRLRPSLGESSQQPCPRCCGQGNIRGVESLALAILRLMEEEAMKEYTGKVIARVPNAVANFLLNEKRAALSAVEHRTRVPLLVVADTVLETPHFEIQRIRVSELKDNEQPSYRIQGAPNDPVAELDEHSHHNAPAREEPAVSRIVPSQPAPERKHEAKQKTKQPVQDNTEDKPSLIRKLLALIVPKAEPEPEPEPAAEEKPSRNRRGGRNRKGNRNARQGNGRDGGNRQNRRNDNRADKQQGSNDNNPRMENPPAAKENTDRKPENRKDEAKGSGEGNRRKNRRGGRNRNRNRNDKPASQADNTGSPTGNKPGTDTVRSEAQAAGEPKSRPAASANTQATGKKTSDSNGETQQTRAEPAPEPQAVDNQATSIQPAAHDAPPAPEAIGADRSASQKAPPQGRSPVSQLATPDSESAKATADSAPAEKSDAVTEKDAPSAPRAATERVTSEPSGEDGPAKTPQDQQEKDDAPAADSKPDEPAAETATQKPRKHNRRRPAGKRPETQKPEQRTDKAQPTSQSESASTAVEPQSAVDDAPKSATPEPRQQSQTTRHAEGDTEENAPSTATRDHSRQDLPESSAMPAEQVVQKVQAELETAKVEQIPEAPAGLYKLKDD